jgi:hypothetical protein
MRHNVTRKALDEYLRRENEKEQKMIKYELMLYDKEEELKSVIERWKQPRKLLIKSKRGS